MNNHKGKNGSAILAAKSFGIWMLCGTLCIVVLEILADRLLSISFSAHSEPNAANSLVQNLWSLAVRAVHYGISAQIVWLPATIIFSIYVFLQGFPNLRRTFLLMGAVVFAFIATGAVIGTVYDAMVDFDALILVYPFAAGLFCWRLTKTVVLPNS